MGVQHRAWAVAWTGGDGVPNHPGPPPTGGITTITLFSYPDEFFPPKFQAYLSIPSILPPLVPQKEASEAKVVTGDITVPAATTKCSTNKMQEFFNHALGCTLRATVDDDGAYWFVAKDVAEALGYGNIRSTLSLLDTDEKGVHTVDTLGGTQTMTTVSESGLYSLILRSRKPEAKPFRRWVTSEVLPSLRKRGKYTVGEAGEGVKDVTKDSVIG